MIPSQNCFVCHALESLYQYFLAVSILNVFSIQFFYYRHVKIYVPLQNMFQSSQMTRSRLKSIFWQYAGLNLRTILPYRPLDRKHLNMSNHFRVWGRYDFELLPSVRLGSSQQYCGIFFQTSQNAQPRHCIM